MLTPYPAGAGPPVLSHRTGPKTPIPQGAQCEQSTESVLLSNLSVLSTLTSTVSPPLDHACIHKCKSDMECPNYPLSLLPPQYLGMKSLIRYGLGSEFAFTRCYGDAVQHVPISH